MPHSRPRRRSAHRATAERLRGRLAALEADLAREREARLRAEDELRHARRLASILEQAPVLVYRVELASPNTSLYLSPYVDQLLGFTAAQWVAVPRRWDSLLHPEDRPSVRNLLDRVYAEGGTTVLEYRIRHQDGHYVWVQDEATLIYDDTGRAIALQGFIVGIDKRKRFEDSLRAAQATYRSLAENLPDGIVRVDRDLIITYVNPAAATLLRLSPEMLIGRRYDAIDLPQHLIEAWGAGLHRVLATRAPSRSEVVFPGGDSLRTLEARSIPEFDAGGALVGILGITRDITEQRAAQDVLRASEERLRSVLTNMPVMLDAFDDQRRLVVWNEECERVTGYSARELLGTDTVMERLYPEPGYFATMLEEWQRRGAYFRNWELTLTRKDGEHRIVSWSNVSTILPVPGWSFWAVGVDVTEQRAAEAALRDREERLRASEAQLRALNADLERRVAERTCELEEANRALADSQHFIARVMEAVPVEVYVFNHRDRRLFYTNRSFQQHLGYSADAPQVLGSYPISRLMHPDDWARISTIDQSYERMSDSDVFVNEYRLRTADGRWRWFASRDIVFTRDESGRPAQMLGTAIDITERQEAQAELNEAFRRLGELNAGLRHSRDLLRTIIDGLENGLALLDRAGTVVMANAYLADLYRLPSPPSGIAWSQICTPSAGVAARAAAEGRLATGRFSLDRNGDPRTIEAHAIPVARQGAPVERVVLHLVDITERLQLEVVALQNERLATGGRLAAIIAHEVNSPLQAIQNFLFLAASDDAAERATYLHLISEEIDRIGTLIRRLLDIHLPDDSAPRLVNLNELIARVLQLTQVTLARRSVAVATELAPELPAVAARADQMIQVLLNLCLNAADAMESGGVLTIRTGLHALPEDARPAGLPPALAVYVAVSDTGSGIEPAVLPRIFEPFFTTKETGTGLGLAICRQIIEQCGGRLLASSASGSGATFTVLLPLPD